MSGARLPAIDLVIDEARLEREAQLAHFEALDAKAGVVLGFAGLLVALSPQRAGWLVAVSRFAAVGSGLAALASFWPRRYWLTDVRVLRDKYLTAELPFTKLRVVDATIAQAAQVRGVLILKARFLKAAMAGLAISVVTIAVALT